MLGKAQRNVFPARSTVVRPLAKGQREFNDRRAYERRTSPRGRRPGREGEHLRRPAADRVQNRVGHTGAVTRRDACVDQRLLRIQHVERAALTGLPPRARRWAMLSPATGADDT